MLAGASCRFCPNAFFLSFSGENLIWITLLLSSRISTHLFPSLYWMRHRHHPISVPGIDGKVENLPSEKNVLGRGRKSNSQMDFQFALFGGKLWSILNRSVLCTYTEVQQPSCEIRTGLGCTEDASSYMVRETAIGNWWISSSKTLQTTLKWGRNRFSRVSRYMTGDESPFNELLFHLLTCTQYSNWRVLPCTRSGSGLNSGYC